MLNLIRKFCVDFSFILFATMEEQMEQIDMKNKPILNLIIKMSLPIIISMIINALYNIVDSFLWLKLVMKQ